MRKLHSTLTALVILAALLYFGVSPDELISSADQPGAKLVSQSHKPVSEASSHRTTSQRNDVATAYANQQGDVQVRGRGTVVKVLPDDNHGSRHQRFILELASGHTILVAHNIDLAARLPDLRRGASVSFNGEYEYNDKGGVLHWTHHDPAGRHDDGWLEYEGKLYQ